MNVKYIVELTEAERESLQAFVKSGSKLARKVKRAQVLLAADQGYQDQDIAQLVGVGTSTVGWHVVEGGRSMFSSRTATYSASTRGMHHIFSCHGLSLFSPSRRRTVSSERDVWSVIETKASARSCRVQRARPSGGFEHAVATSRASSLPVSFPLPPGRGSSSSTTSNGCSTKRFLAR